MRRSVILLLFFFSCFVPTASPQSNDKSIRQIVTELQNQVADLKATIHNQAASIDTLQSKLQAQGNEITQLNNTTSNHSEKLQFITVEGTEMYITGANVNIRDGSGSTSGTPGSPYIATPNGLGNLIIGYNENFSQPVRPRTGSHNLILGEENGYTSTSGLVVGFANSVTAPYSTITGGAFNTSSGMFSSVTGGEQNIATVEGATVGGGRNGQATGIRSSVTGGENNIATAEGATVSGGLGGKATGRWSSVTAGSENTASAESSSVTGGSANTASGLFSSITGGTGNTVTAQSSSISGGGFVTVNSQFSWAAGGLIWP